MRIVSVSVVGSRNDDSEGEVGLFMPPGCQRKKRSRAEWRCAQYGKRVLGSRLSMGASGRQFDSDQVQLMLIDVHYKTILATTRISTDLC